MNLALKSTTALALALTVLGATSAQADMEAARTADMAKRFPGVIVGVKTAHYRGPEWTPVERAVA